jgi:nicotinate-nucleotide adenylyltransferase
MARAIGVLGGTFDPIHCGHIDVGRAAEQALPLTEVVVIPANIPPHRPQPIASAFHRFAMASLAVANLDRWRASDLELVAGARSFTTDTLGQLRNAGYAPLETYFITGADAFAEIESWRDFPGILDCANFAVVSRPGCPAPALHDSLPLLRSRMRQEPFENDRPAPLIFLIDRPTADVSATAIRRRLAAGESIDGLVPPMVRQHIERHGLYRAASAASHPSGMRETTPADRLHGKD